ncbi:hypothetical protein PPROV_000922300 [Pycnococcus provasolii]|uniref:Uncharacterized protein n=2 Tax=Pycnococcus provasolii TaxID=41880 RepID=A0A830HTP6_9CHLO|nr:hypothetical protein PPROV_000922300 [Pycnococcus provasolii]
MATSNSQQRAAVLAALERVEREHARLGDALVAVSRESERKRSLLGDAKSALHAQEERLKAATAHCQAAAQQERQAKQLLQQEMDASKHLATRFVDLSREQAKYSKLRDAEDRRILAGMVEWLDKMSDRKVSVA